MVSAVSYSLGRLRVSPLLGYSYTQFNQRLSGGNAMRAAVVGMMLVALLAFASDRSHGEPNPFLQQQRRSGLVNLLDATQETAGPTQAFVPAINQLDVPAEAELEDADTQIRMAYAPDYKGDPKLLAEKLNAAACEAEDKDDPAERVNDFETTAERI